MTNNPFHVIVIGGGTGGMALAHGLKRAGISVAVYERDRTRTSGLHGYRVGIDPDGSRALKRLLPPELFDVFVSTCARSPKYFSFLKEDLKPNIVLPLVVDEDPVNSEKSVSRMTLRQVLFTGVEDIVHFDKKYTHYENNDDGTVTAFFADGTKASCDLLVAADGANSAVREQYLPQSKVEDAKIISISSKVPLTEESKALLPKEVFEGIGLVLAPKGYSCILHTMEFKWDREGKVKNGIGGNDAELLDQWPGMLFDNTRDYINWGFWASTDKFPADVLTRSREDLIQLTLDMTKDWNPDLRKLFRMGEISTTFVINIRTSVPIEQWKSSNVTLIGDAIHTMTPGQGVGANTALRDAALLCHQLIAFNEGRSTLVDAVHEYETRMIKYGFEAVIASKKQTGGDQPVHKPYLGRLVLASMRGYFWLAARVPAMKRKMAQELYIYRGGDRDDF
ncbi:NAD(P)/FAD-dependent oxidoreductase [Streptomyces sp. H10-C2]|uniref:FAD-dependent oxidoreductase n=1 Tax=unclassified Streptomyces TaxID=2593676 RepID=UPI0024BB7EF8|nr:MULTISPECIES: NAD(P)/FAD-dependent oxidoreductase [unclassified Streptomyces]MDJ0345986.1 NAD(P)/FAD-dependent oxidoreductase [Streptomyces sp. PH10-H1]MDJ0370507.1 NAD(P)/FAD-dependent oxidoreductase [Streptomyces sp. H10-C2]